MQKYLPGFTRLSFTVFTLYFVVVSYGLAALAFHLPTPAYLTPLNTLLALTFAALHSLQRLGWKKALLFFSLVFLVGLLFESIGVATGLVYGPYHYTDKLGVKFLGLVPFLIPLAWCMMTYPSFLIAERLAERAGRWRIFATAALAGLVMTAWDLAMDPFMVLAGHWVWEVKGPYFGIPLQNFWGWWLTTFTSVAIFLFLTRSIKTQPVRQGLISDDWAVLVYAITGISTILVDLLIGLDGPALVGLFAMLPWGISYFLGLKVKTGRS